MKNKLLTGTVILLTVLTAVMAAVVFLTANPANDTVTRYIPMAEAFAAGDAEDAFHPRFGVAFPVISGTLVWLGFSGLTACQLTGLLFFLLAAFPLYGIFREFCSRRTAWLGVIFYLCCSHLHRIFYAGLRENVKTCTMALLVWGVLVLYRDPRSWRAMLAAGTGGALLASIRAEGFAFALCLLLILIGYDLCKRRLRHGRSLAALGLFWLLMTPQLYLNYRWTGYPVPFSGYLRAAERLGWDTEAEHE